MNQQIDISAFRHLYPFESHYLDLNGLKYHYLDEGKGEPIVMLHGNPTWSFYYRSLVNALSGEYRTIVPDHIGCGLSDKPDDKTYDYRLKSRVDDLEKLLDHLDINENITLIVHDWGGMIGMAYALRSPERIARLVIANTAGFFTPNDKGIPFRLWLIRHIAPFAVPAVLGLNIFSFAALYMASSKKLPKDVKAGLTAPYNSWNNRIATLKFVQDIPIKESDPSYQLVDSVQANLHKLSDIPKLICWGEKDFVFTMEFFKEWKRRFPDAEFHTFPDAGHYIFEDVPDKILPLVKSFLKNHPISCNDC
ncbi:MAG: alpha/beta fold hydrolase [Deltaproteobacteria bacterium]|nr:alpha/beta fold hydrolase [Deltaproteobacteria bacterium]MBW2218894.1 alpha/beta fold hydrolase [Deltaproteobacteria bacterium]